MISQHPSFAAAQAATRALRAVFPLVRAEMHTSLAGTVSIELLCHPAEPPQPWGYMQVSFEFSNHPPGPDDDDEQTVCVTRSWQLPDGPVTDHTVEQLYAMTCALTSGREPFAYADVVRSQRWSSRGELLAGHRASHERVEVSIIDDVDVSQLPSIDWDVWAARTWQLFGDCCQISGRSRPQA